LPGAPEPRLTLLRRQDFKIGLSNRLRSLSNRSIVVVGNYCSGPITVEPYRAKARPLHPRRSCFAPISGIGSQVSIIRRLLCGSLTRYPDYWSLITDPWWWRRRVLPPGPNGLLRRPFIAIAGKPAHLI